MAIPEQNPTTGYLPVGEHDATLEELAERYGYNHKRRELLDGLREVMGRLVAKGVTVLWIDGSFVTDKHRPRDIDAVYLCPRDQDPHTWGLLAPDQRQRLKKYYGIDLLGYPSFQRNPTNLASVLTVVEYFQLSRDNEPKGIIRLRLRGLDDTQ